MPHLLLFTIYYHVYFTSNCLLHSYFITADTFKKKTQQHGSVFADTVSNFFLCSFFLFFFRRQSAGRGAHSGLLQGRPEAGQVRGDHLRPGRREEDPGHLEELLLGVARRGVRGGLQRRPEDPGDAGDHGRGPAAPAHRRETSASVSGGT